MKAAQLDPVIEIDGQARRRAQEDACPKGGEHKWILGMIEADGVECQKCHAFLDG